jgi:(p)ppGpp synthase/HD superfamily hydrolase
MDKKDADMLANALFVAAGGHLSQRRDNGEPYFLHIMRVVLAVSGRDQIVAALHDAVEDGHVDLDYVALHFDQDIFEAVRLLTHDDELTYNAYIERLADNPMARRVKLADLEDNMQVFRIGKFTDKRMDKLGKYVKARDYLLSQEYVDNEFCAGSRMGYAEGHSIGYSEGYQSALADSTGNP